MKGTLKKGSISDECIFRFDGYAKKIECANLGQWRPIKVSKATINSPRATVWSGMPKQWVAGPSHLENGSVIGESYKRMLINYAFSGFEDISHTASLYKMVLLRKTGLEEKTSLNRKTPNNWIGRGGPARWSVRFPDLTPCDFCLWGFLEACMHTTPGYCDEDIEGRITRKFW